MKLKSLKAYSRRHGKPENLELAIAKIKEYNRGVEAGKRVLDSTDLQGDIAKGLRATVNRIIREYNLHRQQKINESNRAIIEKVGLKAPKSSKALAKKAKFAKKLDTFYSKQKAYNDTLNGKHSLKLGFNPVNEKQLAKAEAILKLAVDKDIEGLNKSLKVKANQSIYYKSRNKFKKSKSFANYTYLRTLLTHTGEYSELFERGGVALANEMHAFGITAIDIIDSLRATAKSKEAVLDILKINLPKFSHSNQSIISDFLIKNGVSVEDGKDNK